MLLGLERLMQPLGIAAAGHHAAGELVDDDHLAVADDVILVALEELMGAQRLVDVMDEGRVARFIERALFLHRADFAQQSLGMLVAGLGQIDGALLLVEFEVFLDQFRDDRVDRGVEAGAILRGAGDDQRRPRFVDQDRIDLVDNGVGVAALDHLRHVVFHVVAQVVEPEFVVRAVGDVGGVGGAALVVIEPVNDHADGQAEEPVDLAHPVGVASGEIVVDRNDMDAFAGQRVEIDGAGGDQRLALAGLHLGDRAFVQHEAADQLDVEVALLQRALGRFAHGREGGGVKVVERLARLELGPELVGLGPQLLVGQGGEFRLERIDRGDLRPVSFDPAVIGRAEYPFHNGVKLQGGEH